MGNVYKGLHTGEFVIVSCRTGLRVVRSLDTAGHHGCPSVGCACGAEDVRFVRATEEEAEGFWRSMNSSAAEVMEAADRGW